MVHYLRIRDEPGRVLCEVSDEGVSFPLPHLTPEDWRMVATALAEHVRDLHVGAAQAPSTLAAENHRLKTLAGDLAEAHARSLDGVRELEGQE